MKLKTLLKTVIATRVDITVETNDEYYTYYVDYTSDKPSVTYDTHANVPSFIYIPKAVLDREVTFINICNNRLKIEVYEKERGE